VASKSNTDKRKGMARSDVIRKHWAPWLVKQGKFDSVEEVLEGQYCFACGFESSQPLERAHILALADGGSNDIENLHMLCKPCHKASEFISGDKYFEWFSVRNFMHRALESSVANQVGGATSLNALLAMLGVK